MKLDEYAVLGNPVAHSRSPFIHAMFARQTGHELHYGKLLCPMDGFADSLRAFVAAGGRGCNVTVPFKFQAAAMADRCTERALLAGAVNVLHFGPDGWLGDNTDGIGLVRDIEQGAGLTLAGRRVLLVGAGGAAAGVLGPLLAARPAEIVVANRTTERAVALVQRHAGCARQHGVQLRPCGLDDPGRHHDVVLNASVSSLHGEVSPVAASVLRTGTLALDLMYGRAAQPFMAWAEAHGAIGRDGLGMLVEQAAEAFALWRGVMPETASVLQAVRAEMAAGR